MKKLALSVNALKKSFGSLQVLKGISLDAHEGDVISILGASGSGKSTFLRCINLLEMPDEGDVTVGGEIIAMRKRRGRMEPSSRRQVDRIRSELGMVFQSFNLWSHMTVLQNLIEGPVYVQKRPRAECIAEAEALLERVGLGERRHYYPAHLSGGQQQRAAIATRARSRPTGRRPNSSTTPNPTASGSFSPASVRDGAHNRGAPTWRQVAQAGEGTELRLDEAARVRPQRRP